MVIEWVFVIGERVVGTDSLEVEAEEVTVGVDYNMSTSLETVSTSDGKKLPGSIDGVRDIVLNAELPEVYGSSCAYGKSQSSNLTSLEMIIVFVCGLTHLYPLCMWL